MAVEIHGSPLAPAVLLAHGGGQTRHSWKRLVPQLLAHGYRVLSFDLRGHGDSEWCASGQYDTAALAGDLVALTALLRAEVPYAVVGASVGGLGAYRALTTIEQPMARALVLLDIVLRPNENGTERIKHFMHNCASGFSSLEEAAEAITAYHPGSKRPPSPESLARNMRRGEDDRWRWHWDPRLLDAPIGDDRADLLRSFSQGLQVPLLMVRGEHSDMVDEAGLAEMREIHPDMTYALAPGVGHMISTDGNDAYARAILPFLKQHLIP